VDARAFVVSASGRPADLVRFGSFELDRRSGELCRDGRVVTLQEQPLRLLSVLLEHAGELVTRDELRQRLWPADTYVDFEHGLNAAVKRLRDALEDSAETPRYIETVPRRGYRFIGQVPRSPSAAASRRWLPPPTPVIVAAAAMALVAAIATIVTRVPRRHTTVPIRFTVDVEQTGVTAGANVGGEGGLVSICPDNTCVVYRGAREGIGRLYLRPFDQGNAKPLPGTEGGSGPFFSPDGRSLAFFADGLLKTLDLQTMVVTVWGEAPDSRGGAWTPDGSIYFAPSRTSDIQRVTAPGATARAVTRRDAGRGEISHRWPVVLPREGFLVYQTMDSAERSAIVAQRLASGERQTLVEDGECPRLVQGDHLVFAVGDSLHLTRFDAERGRVSGTPVEVVRQTSDGSMESAIAAGRFDISPDGTFAYVRLVRRPADGALWRLNRSGLASPLGEMRREFAYPRFSPDGHRIAVTIAESSGSNVWVYDTGRGTLTRVTLEGTQNQAAIWSRDGRSLTFRSNRAGGYRLFRQPADGSGPVEPLVTSERNVFTGSWSPDGRELLFQRHTYASGYDIWLWSMADQTSRPFLAERFGEWDGIFSPDGRLVAYTSNESGRLEVYVCTYPGRAARRQVSSGGGNSPVWARNGRELFYLSGDKMMTAAVAISPELVVGVPKMLFEGEYAFAGHLANYDVTPDGNGFVMIRGEQKSPWMQLNVVLNWFEEMRRIEARTE
jgi:Tol biopolymer transport system component/DNA-binding winged helix-turn-helix (wHTH) protein